MSKLKNIWIMLGLSLAFSFSAGAQQFPSFDKALFIHKGDTLPYRVQMPLNFDPKKKYPLIIVLHGAGERGNNNEAQLVHGGSLFAKDSIRAKYTAVVVFPQCPSAGYWANVKITTDSITKKRTFNFQKDGEPNKPMATLISLLDNLRDKPYADKHQVYIGGLSMGGMGTFEMLRRKPRYFAAAFTICGGDNPVNAKKYAKKVPLWIFHGGKDDVVTPDHSIMMVGAIQATGGYPKFTLYPNDNHNSWDDAFAETELLPWLLSHKK